MMDAGHIKVYSLTNTAGKGAMPVMTPTLVTEADFEEKTVGVTRFYAAKGVNEQIDLLIRIWRDPRIRIGMIAVVSCSEYDGQYRVTNVEMTHENDNFKSYTKTVGLKTSDITLQKVEENYDITIN